MRITTDMLRELEKAIARTPKRKFESMLAGAIFACAGTEA